MTALILGTVLALAALAFVLHPIFFPPVHRVAALAVKTVERPGERAIAALREIEFDRATGKLSDNDYAQLKDRYTREALAAMRAADAMPDDEIEAAVLAYRSRQPKCVVHGTRPESDAIYCSDCGRYLQGSCADCGRPVTEPGSTYCANCGTRLAA